MNLDQVRTDLLKEKEAQQAIKKAAHEEILKINRKLRGLQFLERDAKELLYDHQENKASLG
jgi:hypothetical protein